MKKFLFIFTLLFVMFGVSASAQTTADYSNIPYVGTEINKALNGNLPFVLVIADPNDKTSIIKYFPIGKMVYTEFNTQYDFCIINANVEENKEYVDFFKPDGLPEVYVVNPQKNIFGKIDNKYHNSEDIKRILKNMLQNNE